MPAMSIQPDESKPMKVLAAQWRCDASYVTSLVDGLEQRGLVERRLHPTDRRAKTIALTPHEGPNLELRFESFNTFNHTQFNGVDSGSTDGNFGQVTSAYDPRVLQLGAKFHF